MAARAIETTMRRAATFVLALAPLLLAGCELLGLESPEKLAAAREAEGRAVGGACRHAGRAIEDCFALNKRADKAAVFAGWRDMNDYMRENKIDEVAPQLSASSAAVPAERPDRSDKSERTGAGAKSRPKDS